MSSPSSRAVGNGRNRWLPSPQRTSKPTGRSPASSRITSTTRPSSIPLVMTRLLSASTPRIRAAIVPVAKDVETLLPDREARFPFWSRPLGVDLLDLGSRRPTAALVDHRVHPFVVAFEHRLHGPVRSVVHPAAESQ